MRIVKLIAISILLVVTWIPASSAQETIKRIIKKGEIRIGMTGNQPPFAMKAKSGELIGYEVDLANMLARSMGVKLNLVQLPFDELIPALKGGKIDAIMSGMTITPERNLSMAFVGPYMVSGKSLLTKSTVLARAASTEEVNENYKMRIAVLAGSTSEDFANDYLTNVDISKVGTYDEALDMLRDDVAKAVIADYPFCVISALKYAHEGLITLNQPLTIEPIGVALPHKDPLFINLMENYMKSLELVGIFDQLQEKWLENGLWLLQVE